MDICKALSQVETFKVKNHTDPWTPEHLDDELTDINSNSEDRLFLFH